MQLGDIDMGCTEHMQSDREARVIGVATGERHRRGHRLRGGRLARVACAVGLVVGGAGGVVGCGGSGAPAAGPVDAALDAAAQACVEKPGCAFTAGGTDPMDPLQAQLGCGPIFTYSSQPALGVGSFCPDTADNRRVLHDHQKAAYLPGYCDPCLTVPPDKLFVFWKLNGPSCPSTCGPTPL
jgi:hypothetical protein